MLMVLISFEWGLKYLKSKCERDTHCGHKYVQTRTIGQPVQVLIKYGLLIKLAIEQARKLEII